MSWLLVVLRYQNYHLVVTSLWRTMWLMCDKFVIDDSVVDVSVISDRDQSENRVEQLTTTLIQWRRTVWIRAQWNQKMNSPCILTPTTKITCEAGIVTRQLEELELRTTWHVFNLFLLTLWTTVKRWSFIDVCKWPHWSVSTKFNFNFLQYKTNRCVAIKIDKINITNSSTSAFLNKLQFAIHTLNVNVYSMRIDG